MRDARVTQIYDNYGVDKSIIQYIIRTYVCSPYKYTFAGSIAVHARKRIYSFG